ncbi:MAG: hypothetical protein HYW15_00625 [Candidatus Giovannonibacteria bacterium]|nr:MAG: hypothetical protein HYW15_00625 [Candidatus Giovannonibacteria bacterium]
MLKKYFIFGIIVFVAWIYVGVGYQWIYKIRVNRAFTEYQGILLESKKFRVRYYEELERLLMSARNATPSEKQKISERLSEIKEEIKKTVERLAEARKKFCDLADEEELFCQEEHNPVPRQGWPI